MVLEVFNEGQESLSLVSVFNTWQGGCSTTEISDCFMLFHSSIGQF